MCTLSWKFSKDQCVHDIYFSRDEQRKRAQAESPELREVDGMKCLFPRDPAGGGTWIGANEYGVVVCLLNDYQAPFDYAAGGIYRSRGLLVSDVLGGVSELQSADKYVRSCVKEADYAPFRLVVFGLGKCTCWCWDGKSLTVDQEVRCPVTSSSWDSKRVEEGRKEIFHQLVVEGELSLDDYHRHQLDGDVESSVCMSREHTQTVSLTKVSVDHRAGLVKIQYGARLSEEVDQDLFAMEHCVALRLNNQ